MLWSLGQNALYLVVLVDVLLTFTHRAGVTQPLETDLSEGTGGIRNFELKY